MYFNKVDDCETSMTEMLSFLTTKSWNPSKPRIEAYDFCVNGGRFPVLMEMIPLEEKAKLSSRSEFHAKLLIFTS